MLNESFDINGNMLYAHLKKKKIHSYVIKFIFVLIAILFI